MDFIQLLVSGSIGGAIVTGVFVLVQIPLNKKLRTPGDRLASEQFAVQVIQERLEEANADRKVLTDTVNYLREDARKRDENDAEDFERELQRVQLIRDLNKRISDLEQQIQKYESRLAALAEKVRNGETITLADIYDTEGLPPDLEDTFRSA